nr:MAG TPA: hypothetical protein [Caudoviricetes sp.]
MEEKETWTDADITNLKSAEVAYLSAKINYLKVCDKYIGKEVEL